MGAKLNESLLVEPASEIDEPNWFGVFIAILMQPLSGCFNHGSTDAEKAKVCFNNTSVCRDLNPQLSLIVRIIHII